jgi:hypothetical protein
MEKEPESNNNIVYLVIGALIVLFFIFIFDYKKNDFTWMHSIIAIVGVGLLIKGSSN